jgi:hypothetical protein
LASKNQGARSKEQGAKSKGPPIFFRVTVTPVVGGWVRGPKKGPGSDLFFSIFSVVFLNPLAEKRRSAQKRDKKMEK